MDDPQGSSIMVQLLLIVVLTMINAYFAASEMAIVSVNKAKIHKYVSDGNKKAKLVEQLIQEPTTFLSTIQVAITLAGFFNSASAATGISMHLAKFLEQWNIPYGETISVVVITILLSFITLVFGELVPKRIALQNAEKFSMFCAKPIVVVSKIASPFIHILSWSTQFILRIFGMHDENVEESLSREEIRSMVISGQENGVFNETETEMINSIFEFDDIQAEDVMTPRTEVFCIDVQAPLKTYIDDLMEMRYTRIPVYKDTIDDIIGVLHIKDFFIEGYKCHGDYNKVDICQILRKPYFVLETKNIDELFKDMQKRRQHMAILVDEYGGFSGIVTIEDLVEEIMGDIEDEHDQVSEPQLSKIGDNVYLIDGFMSIDDFNEELSLNIESDDHDTISGFLMGLFGQVLDDGTTTSIDYQNMHFDILKVEDKHIDKVKLTIISQEQ